MLFRTCSGRWRRFCADAAYALWEDGQTQDAIDRLADAMVLSAGLPDHVTDLGSLKVQKYLGNMILRMAWGPSGRAETGLTSPVIPGMCSDTRPIEALRTLPPPLPAFAWIFLLWIEFEHSLSSKYWDLHHVRLLQLPHPSMRYIAYELKLRRLLRKRPTGNPLVLTGWLE